MKTKSIGEMLREERQLRRLSLEDMAARTRIRQEYLQALENNQFSSLPAATFVKGYIRAYAQLLGFDEQPLIALLRRDFKESAKGRLVPREFIHPLLKRRTSWTPVTAVVMVAAAIFVTLLSYVGFQWYQFNKPPQLAVTAPAEDAVVAAQVVVEGTTDPEAVLLVNAQPVSLKQDGSFSTEVFIPREGLASVTVEAKDRRGKSTVVQRTVTVKY